MSLCFMVNSDSLLRLCIAIGKLHQSQGEPKEALGMRQTTQLLMVLGIAKM